MTAPFWWSWPSWRVEGIAGALLSLALAAWGRSHPWWSYLLVGLVLSCAYEKWLDRHGWAWQDVVQRLPGQIVGLVLWYVAAWIGLV